MTTTAPITTTVIEQRNFQLFLLNITGINNGPFFYCYSKETDKTVTAENNGK
jgi:hypothetical protein